MNVYKRMVVAQNLLAQADLAPPRIAEGDYGFIDVWEGIGCPSLGDVSKFEGDFEELGYLLARIHALPTAWFDEFREQLRLDIPALSDAAIGSHVWWFTARNAKERNWDSIMSYPSEACMRVWADPELFQPMSKAGRRIVTTHGDLHAGNMIQTAMGIKAIDFEFAMVTHAAFDLSHTSGFCCKRNIDDERTFIRSYLHASGLPCTAADVDEVILEARLLVRGTNLGGLGFEIYDAYKDDHDGWIELVRLHKRFVKFAQTIPAEARKAALESGLPLVQAIDCEESRQIREKEKHRVECELQDYLRDVAYLQ